MKRRRMMAHREPRITYRELVEWIVFVLLLLAVLGLFAVEGLRP